MNAYVLVEGKQDAEFLKRLLPSDLLEGVEVVVGGGGSAATSLARSLLATRRRPVTVVRDADTVSPELIRERHTTTEDLLHLASTHVPSRVIQAIPTIEATFFEEPAVLERYFGRPVPEDYVILGKRDPQGVLELLARQSGRPWNLIELLDGLRPDEVERLQSTPVIREVCDFLREAHAFKNGAVSAPSVS